MTRFLKLKLILPLLTAVLLSAALTVPLLVGQLSHSALTAALSRLAQPPVASAATGDWPTFLFDNTRSGYNGAETIINQQTAPNLKVHWTIKVSNIISSEPVEANGMIYWGDWRGAEYGTRLNGRSAWRTSLGTSVASCVATPHGVASSATIATETIGGVSTPVDYVGGGANATFYALNANTGAVIWQTQLSTQTSAYVWSSPALYNGSIYVGLSSLDDCPLIQAGLYQLDAVTGAILNTFYTVPTGCIGGSIWSSPTIDSTLGTVYVSTGNGGTCSTSETMAPAVIALNATNLSLIGSWQVPANQQIPDSDFGATPTLFSATIGGTLHQMLGVINKNGTYYAFDRTNISAGPLWQDQLAAPSSIGQNVSSSAWDGTNLYVAASRTTKGTTCGGTLQALNPATGAIIWQDCLSQSGPDPVIAVPGLVEFGWGNTMMLVNSATGATLFTYQDTARGSTFLAPASISNGVLYVGNADGTFYAFGP